MPPEASNRLIDICSEETGLTRYEVISIAATGPKRYKVYPIDKRAGGQRIICHPSRELKALQYVFLKRILVDLPVHDAATAYKKGATIKDNADRHHGSRVILKLDFESFFPSITVQDWATYARDTLGWNESEIQFSAYVMFWGAGKREPAVLSIGAPTSPLISNAMMFEFDRIMTEHAQALGQVYSRYADDLVISSSDFLDRAETLEAVKIAIRLGAVANLVLNDRKTRLASKATMRQVTGLIITNDGTISIGRDRKRLIRAMVHHALAGQGTGEDRATLSGLLSFVKNVEPRFIESLNKKYSEDNITALLRGKL